MRWAFSVYFDPSMWKFPLRVFLTYFYYIFGPNLGVYRHLHYLCNFCLLVMCECAQMASKLLINENWSQISYNEIRTFGGKGFHSIFLHNFLYFLSPHIPTHFLSLGAIDHAITSLSIDWSQDNKGFYLFWWNLFFKLLIADITTTTLSHLQSMFEMKRKVVVLIFGKREC